jgi:uncharacterized protein (TIGR02594 family)
MLNKLKAAWTNDETPWCGTFVAFCLWSAGHTYPKHWYRALAYTDFGTKLARPAYGCIVVFSRKGGGHVGFVVGRDADGNLMVLGGNQRNAVNIMPFDDKRRPPLAYVWPSIYPVAERFELPILKSDGVFSTDEQ